MAEVDAQAYAVTSANAAAGASNSVETQQPGGSGALRQVVVAGDAVTRANMQTIKAASTAATAADMGAVVHLHPSSPMTQTDTSGTGTISATDVLGGTPGGTGVLIATAPTANSFVSMTVPGGSSQVDVQVLGTATGTYYFEYSMDSTTGSDGNWITGLFRQSGVTNTNLNYLFTVNGVFRGACAGYKYFRIRNVGGTTPSNAVTIRMSNGSGTMFLNAGLPTSTNSIGTVQPGNTANTTAWLVNQQTPATGTITSVTAAASSTTILASNTARKGAHVYNDSTAILYLGITASAVSTTAYTVQIAAGGYFELPNDRLYTGQLTGIWAAANGSARVTELT